MKTVSKLKEESMYEVRLILQFGVKVKIIMPHDEKAIILSNNKTGGYVWNVGVKWMGWWPCRTRGREKYFWGYTEVMNKNKLGEVSLAKGIKMIGKIEGNACWENSRESL